MLSIYTIYDSPSDFPGLFVIKKWDTGKGQEPVQDPRYIYSSTDLEVCRTQVKEMHLTPMHRDHGDDACIIESWV